MYHLLYETTNTVNDKKYIGIHSTADMNDSYLGSGRAMKQAIEKYGAEKFERKILKACDSRKDLLEAEAEMVTKEVVNSREYYNLSLGGKSYIDSLIDMDNEEDFKSHQSAAGKKGGAARMAKMTAEERTNWHRKGGVASVNSGGYDMTEQGKNNIKQARLNSQKYKCPLCDAKAMDGGNFNKHLNVKHGIAKEECYQWRAGEKVDN